MLASGYLLRAGVWLIPEKGLMLPVDQKRRELRPPAVASPDWQKDSVKSAISLRGNPEDGAQREPVAYPEATLQPPV